MTNTDIDYSRHLLGIEHLSREELYNYLDNATHFLEVSERDLKKVPALRGKTVVNLFLEPSTRTRTSFEIAGKRLSADTINMTASGSSVSKGETLLDTARTIAAMNPDVLVIRHRASGAAHFLASRLENTAVINAGDGMHEHPTQALLDLLTLRQHFKDRSGGIEGLRVAIVGDIRHSRVARSNIMAHLLLGNKVRLVGPSTLIPDLLVKENCFGEPLQVFYRLEEGIEGCDVIMLLRMQLERSAGGFIPSLEEYAREYCLTSKIVERYAGDAVVMHPGPINRGIEISGELADSPRSLIEKQVTSGVAVRMAVLFKLATASGEEKRE
ncbi:MAG: aspartate carbamoyltransferase catalytic subunit [Candidatus Dadabacteria bacterium]|nr:MAG: aspartate carbamoyltransferase catalytic subunit [Candidatus Dadabacteria bacterium]